ncbi:MAG TPA: hypothetical protein PLF26_11935, partial [Blastocatellia bacterium]|nr:hypothetical protein [Blastocatellia bacterium]
AGEPLGTGTAGEGIEAVEPRVAGRVDELISYCTADVQITYDLYRYGKENGAVFTRDRSGRRSRIPVMW